MTNVSSTPVTVSEVTRLCGTTINESVVVSQYQSLLGTEDIGIVVNQCIRDVQVWHVPGT